MTEPQNTVLGATTDYPLHLLGWKSFQDLAVSLAEECLRRPVQNFLGTNDAGRDGAFIGRWDGDDSSAGESTIQCKFTSMVNDNLTVSKLKDELEKARFLAAKGLATDYIILTNHPVTGSSELKIKQAFQNVGVKTCRVFGYDWIVRQIKLSPRLRMMVPRLYGLGDLSEIMDERAYAQARLILSTMGEDLQKLVVTEAHRNSVRAISSHNLVLLLGAPATGKSTIGASLAIGAADIWGCSTIRVTSPEDIQRHMNPGTKQFFWIDDAWGSTQYQRQNTEAWNQTFPLMQAAIKAGSRFLITSRDYIWAMAKNDLKLQALPVLNRSQVVINVEELSTQEKAQILYNHLKFGDQSKAFRARVKPYLPELASRRDFLPETARRFGSAFFTEKLSTSRYEVIKFFEQPQGFLLDTISSLSPDCRAAIAVIFMNGGKIASPVPLTELEPATTAFGTTVASIRSQLEALNGSLLLRAQDDKGPYWSYKHPTVSDAFADYVAHNSEQVEIYLKGARPESIVREVVCAGMRVYGAPVFVPDSMHELLAARLVKLELHLLISFLSYRSNRNFTALILGMRPDILKSLQGFSIPVYEDTAARLAATLHKQGLLPPEIRKNFVNELREAAVEEADASFLENGLQEMLSDEEREAILADVDSSVLGDIESHVRRLKHSWNGTIEPEEYFESFRETIGVFAKALGHYWVTHSAEEAINDAIEEMNEDYEQGSPTSDPIVSSTSQNTILVTLFRDVDE